MGFWDFKKKHQILAKSTRSNCPDTLSAPTSLDEGPQMTGACDWVLLDVNPLCLRAKVKKSGRPSRKETLLANDKSAAAAWLLSGAPRGLRGPRRPQTQ